MDMIPMYNNNNNIELAHSEEKMGNLWFESIHNNPHSALSGIALHYIQITLDSDWIKPILYYQYLYE